MTVLSDIIAEATTEFQDSGKVRRHDALNAAFEKVRADDELTDLCVRADLSRRIKESAIRTARKIGEADKRQASLFGLRPAYALDDDAHDVKDTDELTRVEFEAIINLRQRQVNADIAQLTRLRDARRQTAEIWDRHPTWLWRQVEAAYARTQRVAA